MTIDEFRNRFWKNVRRTRGCWLWQGKRDRNGYGVTRIPGKRSPVFAHRVAWMLERGGIPLGSIVMHSCDNPSCVSLAHLSVSSQQVNILDMWLKDRHGRPRGERAPSAKVTEEQVREIRRRRATGEPMTKLGQRFGLHRETVRNICAGKTWSHVQ